MPLRNHARSAHVHLIPGSGNVGRVAEFPCAGEYSAWRFSKWKDPVHEVRLLRMPWPGRTGLNRYGAAAESKPDNLREICRVYPEAFGRDAALHGQSGERPAGVGSICVSAVAAQTACGYPVTATVNASPF